MRIPLFLFLQFISGGAIAAQETPAWTIAASPVPIVTEGIFAVGTEMSGIDSLDGAGCLMVSNETRCAQIGMLTKNPWNLRAGKEIPLIPKQGTDECDFEAVAASQEESCFFVLGSHGVAKKRGKPRPEQEALFHIPADPATKLPDPEKPGAIRSVSLTGWLRKVPQIAPYVGQPLQRNGLNLEGLAYKAGKLFIGCRGPNLDGNAPVLEVSSEALFKTAPMTWPQPVVHLLPLGVGKGIRELTAVSDGFIVLSGCSGSEGSSDFKIPQFYDGDLAFNLFFWKPGATPELEKIGQIPITKGKAEGVLVLEETPEKITVMILYDGSYNGAPHLFTLGRPKAASQVTQ